MPILFVNESASVGDLAKLSIRTSSLKGNGSLKPALDMVLIPREDSWMEMERNAREFLASKAIWPHSSEHDLEWSVRLVKAQNMGGFTFSGGSAGAAFTLSMRTLLEKSPHLKPRFISNLALTSTLAADGRLGKVDGISEKLTSLRSVSSSTVRAAGLADEAFVPLLANDSTRKWIPFPKQFLNGAEDLPTNFLVEDHDDSLTLINLGSTFDELHHRISVFQTSVYWDENPYLGLNYFDTRHSSIFFGRDNETAELESIFREREEDSEDGCSFVAVVGSSGAGKSSFVRAGFAASLLNRTRQTEWTVLAFRRSYSIRTRQNIRRNRLKAPLIVLRPQPLGRRSYEPC